MQLETRQGGLFREALRLVTSPTQSVLPSIDELIRRNRDSIMTALWQYWVAAPKFVYQWVPPQSWPDEVRNSTQAPQGTKKNAPPKSLALSQFSNRGVYVWSPKLAILASLGVIKTNDAKEAAKASYSRPRQLVRLGDDLIALQALVSAPRVFDALRATFGASIVDPLVTGGTLPFEPQTIGDVIDRARPFLVAPRVRAPAELTVRGSQGRPDFTLHVEVARQARQVLGDDLPFAERDGTLPPDVTKWLANIDAIETQLQWALSSSGLINNVQYAPWLPWGLALTAVLRAYATEAFALAALVSLPIGTLYFTPTDGAFAANARTPLIGDRRWVKYSYNAYTAVGLWEAWTGRPVPHADPADVQTYYGGPNYLWRAGDRPTEPLESVAARNIDAFTRFWQDGTGPSFHAPLAGRIQTWSLEQSGVPRLPSDRHAAPGATKKPAGKKGTKNSDNIPISAVGSIESGTEWAIIPALRFPGHDPQGGDHREILANLWHRCAHLHVHVGLYAAEQIYDKLGQLSGLPPPGGKKSTEKPAIRRALTIHDGSPRWGGNHAPHFEHRDGLTFDIFTPFHYAQWLRASKAYDRQEKTPVNFAIFGVCLTQAQHDQRGDKRSAPIFPGEARQFPSVSSRGGSVPERREARGHAGARRRQAKRRRAADEPARARGARPWRHQEAYLCRRDSARLRAHSRRAGVTRRRVRAPRDCENGQAGLRRVRLGTRRPPRPLARGLSRPGQLARGFTVGPHSLPSVLATPRNRLQSARAGAQGADHRRRSYGAAGQTIDRPTPRGQWKEAAGDGPHPAATPCRGDRRAALSIWRCPRVGGQGREGAIPDRRLGRHSFRHSGDELKRRPL